MRIIKALLIIIILFNFFSGSSCDKKVSVTPVEPPPSNGKLIVNSSPEGAAIYLDNLNTGFLTPDTVEWLDSKTYAIKLKKQYFLDVNASVKVKNDSISNFYYDYHSNPNMNGSLNCTSYPPGALISLNDSSTGKVTPKIFYDIFPGNYKVRFSLYNHRDAEVLVVVKSGIEKQADVTLIDTTTWITYNTQNSGLQTDLLQNILIEKGYIKWIGSLEGLVRYDEINFKLYTTENSGLPNNIVYNLYIDNSGNKWICTFSGLAKFDDISWTVYDTSNSGIPSDEITCVTVKNDNDIWIGSFNKGLIHYDGSTWQNYNISNSGIPSNSISAIAADQSGNIWIGTIGDGIAKFSNGSWAVYQSENSGLPSSNNVKYIKVNSDGSLWAAYSIWGIYGGGLAFYDGNSWTQSFLGIPSNRCSSIAFGIDGLVWIGTLTDGFCSYDGSNFNYFDSGNYPLPSNNTLGVAIDAQGNKWIVTNDAGLIKYKGN